MWNLRKNGETNIPGVYIVGDLTEKPLLKLAADSGTNVIRNIVSSSEFLVSGSSKPEETRNQQLETSNAVLDVVIVGAGIAGLSAAREAKALGLSYKILDGDEPFSTVMNYPPNTKVTPDPLDLRPIGGLKISSETKEALLDELRYQTKDMVVTLAVVEKVRKRGDVIEVMLRDHPSLVARAVVLAIGRTGYHRPLIVPGSGLAKVYQRLVDPSAFVGKNCLVVGEGADAKAAVAALTTAGVKVTTVLEHQIVEIKPTLVLVRVDSGRTETLMNDAVFAILGQEDTREFLKRSGIQRCRSCLLQFTRCSYCSK